MKVLITNHSVGSCALCGKIVGLLTHCIVMWGGVEHFMQTLIAQKLALDGVTSHIFLKFFISAKL